MNSKRWRILPLMIIASAACAGCLSSCSSSDDPPPSTAANPGGEDELPPIRPIFEGWDKPEFVLCLTGETHGYLEPCGCSETQSGGLSRRADLLKQIDDRGWPRAALDLGGSLKRNRRQSEIKFEALLDAMQQLGYAAMGVGREELRLDPGYLLSIESPDRFPLVGANTVLFGMEESTMPKPYHSFEVAGKNVGVISVVGDSYRNEVVPPRREGDESLLNVDLKKAGESIAQQLEKLEAGAYGDKPELLVLLSHAELDESREFAKQFPQFDLIVSAGGPEDPGQNGEFVGDSKTLIVTVGHKGKSMGVVGYYPDADPPLKFELIELDNRRFQDTPAMHEVMRRYQERLKDEQIVQNMQSVSHEWGATYVGADACGECHTKAFGKWKSTGHARAYEALSKGREGQEEGWVTRVHDPECLSCHVTGWNPQQVYPYESGFIDADTTPLLKGQQCENCHGPGSIHTDLERQRKAGTVGPQDPELIEWRKKVHLDQETAEKQLCIQCHDLDNSPKFEFKEYWKKIDHPWRD